MKSSSSSITGRVVLIDNGHGCGTMGKKSPDGRLLEWKYAREIAHEVIDRLRAMGYDARGLVPENDDVSLRERCRRVNSLCASCGDDNVLLVSVHVNAAGNGQWLRARGWSAWTSRGRTRADLLAACLYWAAERHLKGQGIRKDHGDGDPDWEAGFYLLKHTRCAAVLTENFFMDNRQDVDFLLSPLGREQVILVHVDGIVRYLSLHRSDNRH